MEIVSALTNRVNVQPPLPGQNEAKTFDARHIKWHINLQIISDILPLGQLPGLWHRWV